MECSISHKEIEPLMHKGKVIWSEGHNANPINDGRCCDECNNGVVIVERMKRMGLGHPDTYIKEHIQNFPINKIKERRKKDGV